MKASKNRLIRTLLILCSFLSAQTTPNSNFLVPIDKGLTEEWTKSLTTRANPEIWEGEQLKYIGMPIGGIACGQLYLAGDGQLWLWDIFKSNYNREDVSSLSFDLMTMNGHYTNPVIADGGIYHPNNGASVEQGFGINITDHKGAQFKRLDNTGFSDVKFRGEYPVGKVYYSDYESPVAVKLQAYSPFIPLDAKSSALPATVMSFTINNTSPEEVTVDLYGWLQNATCPYDSAASLGQRKNTLVSDDNIHTLLCEVEASASGELKTHHGYGSMALSLLNSETNKVYGNNNITLPISNQSLNTVFEETTTSKTLDNKLVGSIGKTITLKANQKQTITFLLTWYFPWHQQTEKGGEMARITDFNKLGRHYLPLFSDALDVAKHIDKEQSNLLSNTLNWNKTWYNGTLPYWLLDRTIIPIDALATQTSHWFDNGRFWGWEGVDCCPGTCTHVWNYAQAMARIFPEIERGLRKDIDYKLSFSPDGAIAHRSENGTEPKADGQAGTIMRVWREHTMSANNDFLKPIWPEVKQSILWLIAQDPSQKGMLEGPQGNTLDATWYGPMGWVSSLYCGALRAGEQMSLEMGDTEFSKTCKTIADRGFQNITDSLFNGEYFIHRPPNYEEINTNTGCHIDQVLGQSWAMQYNLPRVLPEKETKLALNAIWKYNFTPDAGGYAIDHKEIKGHRIYAMPKEAGTLITTWPYGGAANAVPGMSERIEDFKTWKGPGGYFDEVMTGFEYQVAAHMIYEGEADSELVIRGLAIARAVHDRYAPEKRNPYNEIECSDHYARAMASYGVFLAVSGFEYHGPKGIIGFNPKINPSDFKSAFTSAEGWGTYSQTIARGEQSCTLEVNYGKLNLTQVNIHLPKASKLSKVKINGQSVKEYQYDSESGELKITLSFDELNNGDKLEINCLIRN